MLKRFYSHYTFIYPDIYLKNHIVECDDRGRIVACYPFEKEIESTQFFNGMLFFVPQHIAVENVKLPEKFTQFAGGNSSMLECEYLIYDEHKRQLMLR